MPALDHLQAACPGCGEAAFRRRRGEWTLATRILKFDEQTGAITGVCVRCGEPFAVPFLSVQSSDRKVRPVVRRRIALDNGGGAG
jgi:hypothetical protein